MIYRLILFSYFFNNIKKIFFSCLQITLYVYFFGIVSILLNNSLDDLLAIESPIYIFQFSFRYLKYIVDNKYHLGYKATLKLIISLITPYIVYYFFKSLPAKIWIKKFFSMVINIIKKCKIIKKYKKNNENHASTKATNFYSKMSDEEFVLIKKVIMIDVEKLVNMRLNEILDMREKMIFKKDNGAIDN